eukprot:8003524-Pyramimonas_sp.AAC.2
MCYQRDYAPLRSRRESVPVCWRVAVTFGHLRSPAYSRHHPQLAAGAGHHRLPGYGARLRGGRVSNLVRRVAMASGGEDQSRPRHRRHPSREPERVE